MATRKKLVEEIIASFHAIKNKMHPRIMQLGGKGSITHSQLFVLAIIEQHHDIGVKEISKKLNISSSATTQLIDALVNNGYVIRKTDSKDRRALLLGLSTKGQKHIANLKNKRIKMISDLFDVLTDKELEIYLMLHKKMFPCLNIVQKVKLDTFLLAISSFGKNLYNIALCFCLCVCQ